ncbi:MAG TPA: peptidase M20, partial [Firmicutes bacterium]|nr:peptidase M20 [Bacillota bacterium]
MERDHLERLALELIRIPSINGTPGEAQVADWIYRLLAQEEYFKRHPEYLRQVPLKGDPLGRSNVLALVRGEAEVAPTTVLIHGHLDTVGVDDFGELAP